MVQNKQRIQKQNFKPYEIKYHMVECISSRIKNFLTSYLYYQNINFGN